MRKASPAWRTTQAFGLRVGREPEGEGGDAGKLGDRNVNNNIDFGIVGYSLGNRVWNDTNNDGRQQDGEAGIDGVEVRLLNGNGEPVEVGRDGILGTPDDVNSKFQPHTTADGGYYLFRNLPAGSYMVEIGGRVLDGFVLSGASVANANDDTDGDNNGLGQIPPIRSAPISLGRGLSEPQNERSGLSPLRQGNIDVRANMTLDIGLSRP